MGPARQLAGRGDGRRASRGGAAMSVGGGGGATQAVGLSGECERAEAGLAERRGRKEGDGPRGKKRKIGPWERIRAGLVKRKKG